MMANSFDQRSQQFAGCAHPSGKGRAIEVHALASIDLRLPIERLMIRILRYQYVGERARSSEAAVDRSRRRRSLHDAIAGIAAQLRTHMADDLEAGPHVLQHLGDIFTQLAQPSAAVGARLMAGQVGVDFARKMLGQRAAEGLRRSSTLCGRNRLRLLDGTGGLQVFKLKFKLFDLAEDLFALRSEEHPLQLLDQQQQALDLGGSRGERRSVPLMLRLEVILILIVLCEDHRLQRCRIQDIQIRQVEGWEHERSMA